MSSLLNMEFVQALNPLYAFPIVAVILCAFIVYAFGFKSPVQPPSFDGIEEEKKINKKRKSKDTNKGKVVQNGKQNGNISNKAQVVPSNKKREAEKLVSTDTTGTVKTPVIEKKVTKKSKSQNEKKVFQEKMKETFSHEDAGEDGWVQLISKKGRKSRKKDETSSTENQVVVTKHVKNFLVQSDESMPTEVSPVKCINIMENADENNKHALKEDKKKDVDVPVVKSNEDSSLKIEDSKIDAGNLEKENGKLPEESSSKSKKKKKKNNEAVNLGNESVVNSFESPAVQVISEMSSHHADNPPTVVETSEVFSNAVEENKPKESKSSNVVFDELAGLYPEPKEQRKKKRVRRDH